MRARAAALVAVVVVVALGLAAASASAQSGPPPASWTVGVALEGERAYLVDERPFGTELRVLDVADPARPRQLIGREPVDAQHPGA